MSNNTEINIGKKDVTWSYLSTFLQIGSGIILFPLILRILPAETVGIWSLFMSIFSFVMLLDFGFSPSFTRNISYIFSGVNSLMKEGISNDVDKSEVNFGLLADTIGAMKKLYRIIALVTLLLLASVGTYYLLYILKLRFTGDTTNIKISWILFIIVNTYNIYTLYYDSLLIGRGLVKRNKQIVVFSQVVYLVVSALLLLSGFDLLSVVIAQGLSIVVKRVLSYKAFFTREIKNRLSNQKSTNSAEIVKIILPNSAKLGITSLGAFLVLQVSVIMGPFYVNLEDVARYGITVQAVNVITSLGAVFFSTYVPRLSYLRVDGDMSSIKSLYFKSSIVLLGVTVVFGSVLIAIGTPLLQLIQSNTLLLSRPMIFILITIAFLEKNHAIAGGFLLTKNEVPFFKASLISGVATVVLLYVMLEYLNMSLWGMILAPGIAQLAYQNWKWPLEMLKDLNVVKTKPEF